MPVGRAAAWVLALGACVAVVAFLAGRDPDARADRVAAPPVPAAPGGDAPRPAPGPPLDPPGDGTAIPTRQQVLAATGPLRDRLLAIARLDPKERLITAWLLGDDLGKSRDCIDDVLALLHGEDDPEVLHWLGEVIRGGRGALAKLTDEEWARLAPVLLYGQPAERRRAVAGIHAESMRAPPPEILDALRQCVRTESDPEVLAVAARGLLVLHAAWEGMGEDLAGAVGRMPAGARRREVTYVVQRYVAAPVLEARFRKARDPAGRDDWAYAIALAWSQVDPQDADAPDALRFAAVYREVTDRDVRESLLDSCPRDESLVRELREWETDPDLRRTLTDMLHR